MHLTALGQIDPTSQPKQLFLELALGLEMTVTTDA